MIICANCGTTNPSDERICRTCGALLPVSNKSSRVKISTEQIKSKKTGKRSNNNAESTNNTSAKLELAEIPKDNAENEIAQSEKMELEANLDESVENENHSLEKTKEVLREITPSPFSGSIITSKTINKSTSEKKVKKKTKKPLKDDSSTLIKQQQLEADMTKVLKFLSKKITVEELPSEQKKKEEKKKEKPIPPASMNEILKELLKLDLHIEASAIIRNDGTILASAISSRISDSLFATIGQSLSLIGLDIIESLNAGNLTNISLRGTQGVLDLAPIDIKDSPGNEMILIIFSNPRVKSGIIHFAANIVKKQVKEYLGFSK